MNKAIKTKIPKFRMDEKVQARVQGLCAKTGQTMSGLMRGLIERELADNYCPNRPTPDVGQHQS